MAEIHRPCRRVSSWYATDGQGPRVLITATPARPGSTLTRWPSSAPIGDGLGDPELLAESEGIGPVPEPRLLDDLTLCLCIYQSIPVT